MVTIFVNESVIIHIDTYSNIIKGVINTKIFEQCSLNFHRQNIKEMKIVAIYPKQYVTAQ